MRYDSDCPQILRDFLAYHETILDVLTTQPFGCILVLGTSIWMCWPIITSKWMRERNVNYD